MDKLLEFWGIYGTAIMSVVITGAGTLLMFLVRKLFNRTGNKVVMALYETMEQMLGGHSSNEHVRRTVKELPFVRDMKNFTENLTLDWELKLVEFKRRLLSPKLTATEREVYEFQYNMLISRIGYNNLTKETKEILEKLDKLKGE